VVCHARKVFNCGLFLIPALLISANFFGFYVNYLSPPFVPLLYNQYPPTFKPYNNENKKIPQTFMSFICSFLMLPVFGQNTGAPILYFVEDF